MATNWIGLGDGPVMMTPDEGAAVWARVAQGNRERRAIETEIDAMIDAMVAPVAGTSPNDVAARMIDLARTAYGIAARRPALERNGEDVESYGIELRTSTRWMRDVEEALARRGVGRLDYQPGSRSNRYSATAASFLVDTADRVNPDALEYVYRAVMHYALLAGLKERR